MKKQLLTITSFAICLTISACGDSVTNTDSSYVTASDSGWRINPPGDLNSFFDCLAKSGTTVVSAHRGGPYPGQPENAIETMSAVLQQTPALMEIDVATSSDGVLYLMHDDTLDRTTTGSGEANALPWGAIQKLTLEDNDGDATNYAPSRFDEALAWADGRTILQIDFKRSTRYEDVAAEVKRQDAEDCVILIAYSMASARKLHQLMPNAMISLSLNSQSELNRAVASGIPDDRIMGFTGIEDPRPRLFSVLNSRDVEVIFGTLGGRDSIDNDIARSGYHALYAEIASQGADIIATDRPHEAHAALLADGRGLVEGACGVSFTKG